VGEGKRWDAEGSSRVCLPQACAYLDEDLLEARIHAFFVQLVAVERQALDELLDRALRLERKQRQTERNVAPLPRVLAEPEALAKLLDDALRLLFLWFIYRGRQRDAVVTIYIRDVTTASVTFSMNVKM